MGLFAKKKDETEHKDAHDIKSASSSPTPPPFNQAPSSAAPAQSQENSFVNPFATNNAQQQPASTPSTPQSSTEPTPVMPSTNQNPEMPATASSFPGTTQTPQMQTTPTSQAQSQGVDEERLQELIDESVEKIIEERWEKVTANVEKVVSWKGKIEQEVQLLKEDIVTIKNSFETFEKRLMNKISSYDKNILDVNSEIKALDKVFQKITPTLVNNVNELSRIADDLKQSKSDSQNKKSKE